MTNTISSGAEKGSTIAQCACAGISCAHFGFLISKYASAANVYYVYGKISTKILKFYDLLPYQEPARQAAEGRELDDVYTLALRTNSLKWDLSRHWIWNIVSFWEIPFLCIYWVTKLLWTMFKNYRLIYIIMILARDFMADSGIGIALSVTGEGGGQTPNRARLEDSFEAGRSIEAIGGRWRSLELKQWK